MAELKQFEAISTSDYSELEDLLIETVNDKFRKEEISENYYKYVVDLQNKVFITSMSSDEVVNSAKLAIDILEELKNINNSGVNRNEIKRIETEIVNEYTEDRVMQLISIWNKIKTDRLSDLVRESDRVRRVGGAWALLLANPALISSIYAVYDQIVDSFDDEDLYSNSAYFLMRSIMHMHSDDSPKN